MQVQAQVQSQAQNRAQYRDSTLAQTDAGACHPADTVDAPALPADVKRDRIQQRLQDASCLDEAMLDAPAADLLQDRIRDRLHDGSCLLDDTCIENDHDYSYDHVHDGPPPAGGYGADNS
jgi:hypothetical protein